MAYFIYGEDTFRSKQKLNAIKQKYIDSSLGDTNLAIIEGQSAKGDEIIRQLWAMPFLAPKRLVIIKNLLLSGNKETQQSTAEFLPKIPETTVAIFFEEGTPDKRLGLFKALNKPKLAEEFIPLTGIKLRQWVELQFKNSQKTAEPRLLDFLIQAIGSDLWRLEQEINKLVNFSGRSEVTLEQGKKLIHVEQEGDTFQLIDALGEKNAKLAMNHLRARLQSGDAPQYLLSMIVYGFRTLLIVKDLISKDPKRNSAPGIHPFVWRKSIQQAKNFSLDRLEKIYRRLLDFDCATKTSIIEPSIALDLAIFELCEETQGGDFDYLAVNQGTS
jgi:DNA polymerase-3 subunit delta